MAARIAITFDSASTDMVRDLAVALHNVGLTNTLMVGVNGPECWSGSTPKLTPAQFASVVGSIVKYDGESIGATLRRRAAS